MPIRQPQRPGSTGGQPGEIAGVIAFLAYPKASYITGAVFAADGGRTPSDPGGPAGTAPGPGRHSVRHV